MVASLVFGSSDGPDSFFDTLQPPGGNALTLTLTATSLAEYLRKGTARILSPGPADRSGGGTVA